MIILYFKNLYSLFIDMSFYLVIGLILTGFLHAFVKKDVILKHLGKNNFGSVVKSSIFGVPLPLCSCGVVPTALYLEKSGASKGAVISFLTSTPQTGVDSLIATYGLLGPLFAFYRAISAFISGIISGMITNLFYKDSQLNFKPQHETIKKSCCCCSTKDEPKETELSFWKKIKLAFEYAFGEFLDDMVFNFIIGLLIAALISTFVPANLLSNFNNPIISMLFAVIIGIPIYICSTASIPIAVSLMVKGLSPGTAFVFLFAGPVTNAASLTILFKSLGKKVVTIYLVSTIVCAIFFGLFFDIIIKITNYSEISNIVANYNTKSTPLYIVIIAILFGILILKSLFKKLFVK